ncbi:hypothetical protein B9G69_007790 [Bdellovibrio sp. SKB1291214]|uniref:hypothetical protein n=1 Tax=Bdellovibrio sp. SKB1291214 TaxID=1732569 RepID=UPI000B518D82|nr:hypothetical protein [Bdellovibrio sp. SKB1291214]UYL10477.1 hypothetical protein B9G69_007790 [Bdellovibrio sp. SKB1291214]
MKYFSFLFLFLSLTLFTSCATQEKQIPRDIASLQSSGAMEGIWFLQGTSSTRGPYNGELELRKSSDGTYDAIRIVTYINYFYDGLKVQEVWTGKAVAAGDTLVMSYDLRQGDFITKLGTDQRNSSDFTNPITVVTRFIATDKGLASQFSDKKFSNYTEWITTRRNLEAKPLWINLRTNVDARGPDVPWAVQKVINIFKRDIGYGKDPYVQSFKNRKEFKEERPFIVFDPTDYNFYQANKDIIRVVNKITDNISITEASVKRNAYSPTLKEKAASYDKNTVTHHINEIGMVSKADVDANGKLIAYRYDGDSALWTGMYIGSQAMRYMNTKDPEALANVRKSLRAMFILMDITEDPAEFARTLMPYRPGEPIPNKWHQGKGIYSNMLWLEGGNNDMFKGLTHSMMWASMVIPENDQEIWSHLRDKSRRLLKLRIYDEKSQNQAPSLGLAALINKDEKLRDKYQNAYTKLRWKPSSYSMDTTFYWHGSADWSGVNLGLVGDITDIMIAQRLGETKIRDRLRERLMDSWVTYSPAQRHLLTMVAFGFAYSQGTRGDNFRKESSEIKFMSALNNAAWGIREIPYPRPNLDVSIDHSQRPDWCISPIPRLFWKSLKSPQPSNEYFYQGLYNYPVFEHQAFTSNFVWKDTAFGYKDSHGRGSENAGVDYLYAYWLAKYVGVPNVD